MVLVSTAVIKQSGNIAGFGVGVDLRPKRGRGNGILDRMGAG
jgi:hypothetical protein